MEKGSYYGAATGIVGLRLFPNPDFDERAAQAWDANRFYTDPDATTTRTSWSGRIASACPAGSATSVRTRSTRRRTRTTRSGRTSARTSARSTSGSTGSSTGTPITTDFVFQLFHTSRPGLARHLADLDRQHQQSADDERGLPAGAAAGAGEAVGEGNARRRRARQPAVQRFRERRAADAVLRGAGHGLDAARAEGWRRFGRRARRAQPRLHQHRHVQRRVAAALQRAGRRQARHADYDCGRAEEFRLLQGHRSADARHRPVLSQDDRRPSSQGRARRRAATCRRTSRC